MREIVAIEIKLLSVSFSQYVSIADAVISLYTHFLIPSYGSIYFSSNEVARAVLAQITSYAPTD